MSTPQPQVCIVAISPVVRDARVLRQARHIAKEFPVTVIGQGHNPFVNESNIRWLALESTGVVHPNFQSRQRLFTRLAPMFPRFYERALMEEPQWRYAWHLVQAAPYRVIYCNDVETIPLGVAARRATHAKIIADLHEFAPAEQELESFDAHRHRLVCGILKKFAPQVRACFTVSDAFVKPYRDQFCLPKPVVIYNAPELPDPLPAPRAPDGCIQLVHHGVPARPRALDSLIKTVGLCDERFVLNFMLVGGDQDYLKELRAMAASSAPGKVVFHNPVQPSEIVQKIAQFDVGIYILPPTSFNHEQAMPNKFFDFIVAGLGMAIGPSPAMAAKVKEHGIGWIAEDFTAEAMAHTLNSLTVESVEQAKAASRTLRLKLNGGTEMQKVLEAVRKLAPFK